MADSAVQQSLLRMPQTGSTYVKPSQRLVSLDVARGITIAFMILVNNAGSGRFAYWPLKHSEWNGWTPTDLVFPSFLLLAGISIVFSTAARTARGEAKSVLLRHIFRRAVILFAIGVLVHGYPDFHWATLRIYGVLQRIALCYLVVSILYLWTRRAATLAAITVAYLLGYWILMRWMPVPGYGLPVRDIPLLDKDLNWVALVDRHVFPGRLYEKVRDPEGLLSTIPAIGTTLLGVLTGIWLRTTRSFSSKAGGLLAASVTGIALGSLWGVWFPINKKLWTSSFVLFAGACTLLLLAICYLLIEIKKRDGAWTYPWRVFGSNAVVAYIFAELLESTLNAIHLTQPGGTISLKAFLYKEVYYPIVNPSFGSLLYSLSIVLICFLPAALLYEKRIFIKL
jgi:predicted acyltransferase